MSDRPSRRAYPLDPDPLYVEPQLIVVPPPRERSGMVVLWVLAAFAITAIALLAFALIPAPRSGSDPTTPPPGSDAAGFVRASTPARAGTSSPDQSGAPRLGSGAPTSYSGFAGWAVPSLGRSYLALREPRGTLVRICSIGGCWETRSTDYGPSSRIRPSRVADIAVVQWERLCGVPRRFGLCEVSVLLLKRPGGPIRTAPPTDVQR